MGVHGLLGWIQCLRTKQPRGAPDWSAYKGKKIGIDILGFLYRAKSRRQSAVLYIARLIAAFRRCGMIPVPVFDGRPPQEKQPLLDNRLSRRSERTPTFFTGEEREVIKQLFYVCGVTPLNASGEADNVLAYLESRGEIAAVISHDMDLLVRGVEQLWVPESYALPGDTEGWSLYSCTELCKTASLSYTQFVAMSVLMGCDYTHGLPSLHYRVAYALVLNHSLETIVEQRGWKDPAPYQHAVAMFQGTSDTPESMMNERQWAKLQAPFGDPEWTTLFSLRDTLLRSLSAPDFRDLCSFGDDLLGLAGDGSQDHPKGAD